MPPLTPAKTDPEYANERLRRAKDPESFGVGDAKARRKQAEKEQETLARQAEKEEAARKEREAAELAEKEEAARKEREAKEQIDAAAAGTKGKSGK